MFQRRARAAPPAIPSSNARIPPAQVTFVNLTLSAMAPVATANNNDQPTRSEVLMQHFRRAPIERRVILDHITGTFLPGRLSAILGRRDVHE